MEALRQIYESGPDFVTIPPELRRRRLEIIILPLEEPANQEIADKEVLKFWGCIPDFPDIEWEGDYETRVELP